MADPAQGLNVLEVLERVAKVYEQWKTRALKAERELADANQRVEVLEQAGAVDKRTIALKDRYLEKANVAVQNMSNALMERKAELAEVQKQYRELVEEYDRMAAASGFGELGREGDAEQIAELRAENERLKRDMEEMRRSQQQQQQPNLAPLQPAPAPERRREDAEEEEEEEEGPVAQPVFTPEQQREIARREAEIVELEGTRNGVLERMINASKRLNMEEAKVPMNMQETLGLRQLIVGLDTRAEQLKAQIAKNKRNLNQYKRRHTKKARVGTCIGCSAETKYQCNTCSKAPLCTNKACVDMHKKECGVN